MEICFFLIKIDLEMMATTNQNKGEAEMVTSDRKDVRAKFTGRDRHRSDIQISKSHSMKRYFVGVPQ